jgi:mannose-6-phosphate isomerase-like protein (cupin superfamily)
MEDKNRVIENPVLGDKIIFIKTAEETSGEYLLMKSELSPHGGVTLHYHVTFTEKFDVLEGQLHVVVAGDHKLLEVGQSAFAPLKAHHRFYSTSDTPVKYMVEIRPARQFEKSLRIAYGLARDGRVNGKGIPTNIWHLALLFELAESYLPGLPLLIQQRIFGALASIAKWRGVNKELEKYLWRST